MEYILQTEHLNKKYGKACVLNDLTMNVPKGAIYGFVGRNGAGKTTLIRVITGLHTVTSGKYSIFGCGNDSAALIEKRKKIGAVVETPSIYLDLNAKANLEMQCDVFGLPKTGVDQALEMVGLANTGKKKAKNFSLGMRQRLGIAMSLISNPEFLILDEPINGLDPQGILEVREFILRLNQQYGITILISSHILEELSKLATHYGFIEKGHIIKECSADELTSHLRASVRLNVDDSRKLADVLAGMNYSFEVVSPTDVLVYTPFAVTKFIKELDREGIFVNKMESNHENLENYFMNLVGGVRQ